MNTKTLITLLLITFSFNFSHAKHDDSQNRLVERTSTVMSFVEQSADRLSDQTQLKVLEHLTAIEDLVKHGDHSNRPAPAALRSVRGQIENTDFSFNVSDLADLNKQCFAFIYQKLPVPRVDEIYVSVDYGQPKVVRNPHLYWKNEGAICSQIVDAARSAGISYSGSKLFYTGSIGEKSFIFSAMRIPEIAAKCEGFVSEKISSANIINVSVNFGPSTELINRNFEWKSSFEICQLILQQKQK